MFRKVAIEIVRITGRGFCPLGHQIGEHWEITDKVPAGMCWGAFQSLMPYISALMLGGEFPWADDPHVGEFACPDVKNPVVFRVWKVEEGS